MQQIETYILVFGIIVIVGQIFSKSIFPISLILVVAGMILSLIPAFPNVTLNSELVIDVFLPILIYQISSSSSWTDTKKNLRPITMLSIGHVLFITIIVAYVIHLLLPQLGWPLAFVLGAIISPPDDVAIVTLAEKIRLPQRVITILEGEGLLNDATALILFRFALIATLTHQFVLMSAMSDFLVLVVCETIYGFILGSLLGELRLKISNTSLHMMASLLTPFLAYVPALLLGGSGVIATVVTGFVISHRYSVKFSPDFRLISRAIWPMLTYGITCLLFLSVGLNMRSILNNISSIPLSSLALYSTCVILTVIIGRFIWVYVAVLFLPRFLFPFIAKKDPYPPWQYPFIVSWAGMRGSISLAAAFAVPLLPNSIEGINPRDLLIFIVFTVIVATFVIQGMTLPWIIKKIGANQLGEDENYQDHVSELFARKEIARAVLRWLRAYKKQINNDPLLTDQINLNIKVYKIRKTHLKERLSEHSKPGFHGQGDEEKSVNLLLLMIIEVEKTVLMDLWRKEKISFSVRNNLLNKLDHRMKDLPG